MNAGFEWIRQTAAELVTQGLLPAAFSYGFLVNAVLCGLLIGPLLGGVGTMVVTKRMAFFSQAVGNAAMTGVAIGVMFGEHYTEPYYSMFTFCIVFALLLNFTRNRTRMSSDTVIGVFLAVSLALGATTLLWVSARVNAHILESILFGSVLFVSDKDLSVLLVVSLLVLAIGLPLFNRMLLASLNPSLAHARGVNTVLLDYVFVLAVTLITVACVKIIGAALVEALLVVPAAAARNVARSMRSFVVLSMLIATVSCMLGIIVPMQWDLPVPSGGAIVLTAAAFFVLTMGLRMALPGFREARH